MHADAKTVGAHLDQPGSPVQTLLHRAQHLGDIQQLLRDWAHEPLAHSLRIANERDGVVVVYADSAAAYTQVRYRQQELLNLLRQRLGPAYQKVEIKMRPAAQNGGSTRV